MQVSVKHASESEISPENGSFTHNLRWWTRICFIIGLPWGELTYRWYVKLFAFLFLIGDFALGLTALTVVTYKFAYETKNSTTEQYSSVIIFYNNFMVTSVLHGIMVCKMNELRSILGDFNRCIIVDMKLKRQLQKATILLILYTLITQLFTKMLAISANLPILDWPKLPNKVFWLLWGSLQAYPVIIGYTIALLIVTLGHQFAFLKEAISCQSGATWENVFERYIELSKLAGKLQKCFSVPLMLIFSHVLISLCTTAFFLVEFITSGNHYRTHWVIIYALELCVRCTCLCVAADYMKDQANSMSLQIAEADVKLSHSRYEKDVLRGFSINVRNLNYLTTFSVGGFCQLGKSLLLAMLAAIVSYLVLLCQLRGDESDRTLDPARILK